MNNVEMHVHAAVAKLDDHLLILGIDAVIGRVKQLDFALRLAACWNACREFDDPAKGVEALREQSKGKCSRWTASENERLCTELSKSQVHARVLQEELRQLRQLNIANNAEIDCRRSANSTLAEENEKIRAELSKSETYVEVLQDQLRVNKLAYAALRDLAIGKTPVCPDLRPKPESAQPEVNVQDGAYESFMRFTTIGPGIETTSYVSTDKFLAEENGKLRKAGCKLAEAAIRVASEYDGAHRLMLAVAEWSMAVANEGGRGDNHQSAATSTA